MVLFESLSSLRILLVIVITLLITFANNFQLVVNVNPSSLY